MGEGASARARSGIAEYRGRRFRSRDRCRPGRGCDRRGRRRCWGSTPESSPPGWGRSPSARHCRGRRPCSASTPEWSRPFWGRRSLQRRCRGRRRCWGSTPEWSRSGCEGAVVAKAVVAKAAFVVVDVVTGQTRRGLHGRRGLRGRGTRGGDHDLRRRRACSPEPRRRSQIHRKGDRESGDDDPRGRLAHWELLDVGGLTSPASACAGHNS